MLNLNTFLEQLIKYQTDLVNSLLRRMIYFQQADKHELSWDGRMWTMGVSIEMAKLAPKLSRRGTSRRKVS